MLKNWVEDISCAVMVAEDRSPVGTRVASWYSPSWRDSTPGVPVLVNRGDWGGVSSSLILAVCVDAIIVPVWIALLVLYAVPGITWVVRRVTG